MSKNSENSNGDLEWIFNTDVSALSTSVTEKMIKKFMENPFVPIGLCTTLFALFHGLRSFNRGDSVTSQRMMRLRIGAQAFTIAAITIGSLVKLNKIQNEQKK